MAKTLAQLNVLLSLKKSNFEKGLGKVTHSLERFSKRVGKVGQTLTTNITAPLVGLGVAAVSQAAKFEKLEVQLATLTGSAEKAGEQFGKLTDFAAKTPFQLEQLTKANNTLIGFGLSADQAFHSLTQLADVAAATGGNLHGMTVAFGQAAAEGKVMSKDLRQFINNDVPILDILADSMGVARDEIFDLASQSKISFADIQQAISKATSEGGRFSGATEKLSKTISGVMSTLKDNVSIAFAEFGNAIVEATNLNEVLVTFSQKVQDAVKWFRSLSAETQKNIVKWAAIVAAIGPALIIFSKLVGILTTLGQSLLSLARFLRFLISTVGLVVAAILGLGAAAIYVYGNWEAFKTRFKALWVNIKNDLLRAINVMIKALNRFPGFKKLFGEIKTLELTEAVDTTDAKFKGFGETVKDVAKEVAALMGMDFAVPTPEPPSVPEVTAPDPFKGYSSGGGSGARASNITRLDTKGITPVAATGGARLESLNQQLEVLKIKLSETNSLGTFRQIQGEIIGVQTQIDTLTNDKLPTVGTALANTTNFLADNFELIGSTMQNMFLGLWDSIGEGGANAIKSLFAPLISLIKKLAAAAIAAGILSLLLGALNIKKIKDVTTNFKGLFGSFTGIALAKGGITTGPTQALIGDNPSGKEAVIPFERMPEFLKMFMPTGGGGGDVVFRISGSDLIGVMENSSHDMGRVRGYGLKTP